ncbi:hypothetical protein HPB50_026527 [Hyalomma asiaticum]|uniref:Uncharacterized protein n=1 Tax=Hyalomma asiaticum TaxID=266040 RepID=A0ACB7S9W6_HYAAI|nr:hypothetical protein HPB50_026527 [Hyalomma asiaticum]
MRGGARGGRSLCTPELRVPPCSPVLLALDECADLAATSSTMVVGPSFRDSAQLRQSGAPTCRSRSVLRQPGGMAMLSLKISVPDNKVIKTIQFEPGTLVYDACRIIRDKVPDSALGDAKEYGLFLTDDDPKKSGCWLENGKALGYYLLKSGVMHSNVLPLRQPGGMAMLSLKISVPDNKVIKTIQFEPGTLVYDACRIIRDKVPDSALGDAKEYGLFLTDDDPKKSGCWLENGKALGYYLLKSGDTLEYRKKLRPLRVRMLDGSVKTVLVDDSQPIANLMVVICTKIECFRAINNKIAKKSRKVLFIVDSCSGHGKIENLEAVTVEFLSANMMSVLQPMDYGKNGKGYKIDLPEAVHLLSSTWQQVRIVAIANSFAHAGFSRAASLPEAETDDFTDCEELCQEVVKLTGNGAAESDVTFLKYTCEQDVPVTGEMTNAEVVQTVTDGGDGGDEPPREVPTSAEARNLLHLL